MGASLPSPSIAFELRLCLESDRDPQNWKNLYVFTFTIVHYMHYESSTSSLIGGEYRNV